MKKALLWYRKVCSAYRCENCILRLSPKAIFLMSFLFLILSSSGSFSQDNIYGDYLLGSLDNKVSLDLENAQLVDVLKMLSQQINLNFISTEAVGARALTLYMEEVPLKEAMDVIFKANNLAYDYYPDSDIFVVKEMGKPTLELKTKIYQLKYARVGSSKMETEIASMLESSGGESEEGEEEGIKGVIESILTEVGKVTEDPMTNSLIVVDVPVQFPLIDRVISELDAPSPKIMIEVEMMDVSKSHLDEMGFNFENGIIGGFATGMGSRETTFPWFGKWSGQGIGGAAPSLQTLDFTDLTAVVKFLSQDITTKFIARPKILTLANETAEVNLTLNEVIGLTSTTEGDTTTQSIERDDTGTKLRVTPQVNLATNEITLVVDLFNKESVNSTITVSGLTGGFVKNIEERSTKSIVRLKTGETLFIGGLLKKKEEETITKIPFFGDLPLIGRLFRYTSRPIESNIERELLVFVTPRILKEGENLIEKAKALPREQQNYSKESSIKVALDRYNR